MSGTLRLRGATSGYSELQAPAVAADQTFVLPTAGGTLLTTDSPVAQLTLELGSASEPSLRFEGDTDTGLFSQGTNTLNLVTGGSSKVVLGADAHTIYAGTGATVRAVDIDSSGNVGVGTSTARAGLTVALGSSTIPTAGASTAAAIFGNELDDGTYGVIIGANGSGTGYLQAQRGDGLTDVYPLAIQPNGGNVGIGTTSPSAALHIKKTSAGSDPTHLLLSNSSASSGTETSIYFAPNVVGAIRAAKITGINEDGGNSTALTFSTNAEGAAPTERARIDSSGRLLVGTSSSRNNAVSASSLQIEGTDGGTGLSIIRNGGGNSAYLQIGSTGGSSVGSTTATPASAYISQIVFSGSDGSAMKPGAYITAANDQGSAWSVGDCPTRLEFSTTADGASSPTERMRIRQDGEFLMYDVYTRTDAASVNVVVKSDGSLRRSVSSIKYKTEVETLQDSYADAILNVRPVWYRSLCDGNSPEHSWWGFIAEEVAEIDPRLVHWKTTEPVVQDDGSLEHVPCEPEPEGVAYDRFVPHLLNLIKRQKEQIEAMEARLSALESA